MTALPAVAQGLDLPAPLQSAETQRATISYYETGDPAGRPVLFVHGLPFSSYIWRNVLPEMNQNQRLIAVDLIGFGDSTGNGYGVQDQADHLADFIDVMGLSDVTLMAHDWGAGISLVYAAQNPDDVAAFAFMEGSMPPVYPRPAYDQMPERIAGMFKSMRDENAEENVLEANIWQEVIMPTMTGDPLPDPVVAEYKRPFPTPESRQPLLDMSRSLPIGGEPAAVSQAYSAAVEWWTKTEIPKLVLYAEPGRLFKQDMAEWTQANAVNVTIASIGPGHHALQEDAPQAVADGLQTWLDTLEN
ncbi:haloalkane dehalogenase [Sulfitobacter sp. 1151]|uniref:Haloalkane dehalogenase n=1 Tax=Parasulfitobacter algicola TaxID=2614809 RepID=A0ABX2ISI1_9RHOB|nr:haloalkane dehalogenase [Sulfitobacter algicola]